MPIRLYLIQEAADIWRLKPRTVQRWILFRKVEHVKIGGRVRIPEAEIVRVIEDGTVPRLTGKLPWDETAPEQVPT